MIEKALAALNAGIRKVIIPAKNKKDLEDVPEEALEVLEIVPVETVDEVLKHALVDGGETAREGAKQEGASHRRHRGEVRKRKVRRK